MTPNRIINFYFRKEIALNRAAKDALKNVENILGEKGWTNIENQVATLIL